MLLNFLLGLLIVVALAMTGLVLLQRSEGGALGIGGGGGGQFMTARGAGNILTKGTQILGVMFFGLCLLITFLTARQSGVDSLTDQMQDLSIDPSAATPTLPQPAAPAAPVPNTFEAPAATLDPFAPPPAPQ